MEILMMFGLGAVAVLICTAIYEYFKATEEKRKRIMAFARKFAKSCVKISLLLAAIATLVYCARGMLSDSISDMAEFVTSAENPEE